MSERLLRTLRVRNEHRPGVFGRLSTEIGAAGVNLGDIRTVWVGPDHIVRDIDVLMESIETIGALVERVNRLEAVDLLEIIDDVHDLHIDGKLEVRATHPVQSIADLRRVYTPGVAEVVRSIENDPDASYNYTVRGKSVAIVTNGTRVLSLGNVGPVAALPVMEGKAALLQQFMDISAWPIVLNLREPRAMVDAVKAFAHGFGAIQLEDIESPACFDVEAMLIEELDMPVLHDDQHGTGVAALAAIGNATARAGMKLEEVQIGVLGLGAAGTAIAKMLQQATKHPVMGYDPNPDAILRLTQSGGQAAASQDELMAQCDLIVAVSGRQGLIKPESVRKGQGILALTNPNPEISPSDALQAGAAFAADGRSVNNLLGFPGILRAALDTRARCINGAMYLAAARAIAEHAGSHELVPNPLRRDVHRAVARAVAQAAQQSGVARQLAPSDYMRVSEPYSSLNGAG